MAISKALPRIVGLTVLTGAGILAQQGTAHASVILDAATTDGGSSTAAAPSSHIQMLTEKYGAGHSIGTVKNTSSSNSDPNIVSSSSSKTSCAGSNAIKTVTYTVDGKTVSTLSGNVKQGSTVTATFTLKDDCDNTQVGLAAYQAPSNVWDASKADQQVLVDHQSGTYKAGQSYTLTVTAPSCDFQVDFFTGPVLDKLSATADYNVPNGNLIDADNGGDNTCVPPTVTPPVTPPTTTPPVHDDSCPTDEASRITSYSWTINGVKGFKTLAGNVKPGDKVEVDFTIAANCDDEQLSLASYAAPSDTFDASTADQQVLIDSQTGTFGPGEHVLDVNVDACYYQVDFVHGGVLTKLGPDGSDNFYNDNLIESANGGSACQTPPPPTTTPPTTTPPQVEAETITAQPAAVQSQQLAFTGSNTEQLILIGVGLTMMGAAFERASARMRRRAA